MSQTFYVLHDASGNITGNGISLDGTLPPGALECEADHYGDISAYKVDLTVNPPAIVNAPPPPVSNLRATKLAEINAACDAEVGKLRATYPDNEVASWDKQAREAEAFTANASASTPLLTALAAARGIALADLASRVLLKSTAFAQQSGALIGKRQALEDQLNAIADTDPDAAAKISAIQWG